MKKSIITLSLVLSLLPALVSAGTIKIPKDDPAASLTIPNSWEPEDSDGGVLAESPDNVATVFFKAVGTEKEMGTLFDGTLLVAFQIYKQRCFEKRG